MNVDLEDKDRRVISRALKMCEYDTETAALLLESLIIKKNAKLGELRELNAMLTDKIGKFEKEIRDELL